MKVPAWAFAASLAMHLLGCATPKPAEERATPQAPVGIQSHQRSLDGGYVVDFQVETKRSGIDGVSCFSFVTGTLTNRSGGTLSQRSGLQFLFYHDGRLLFRDLTYPRINVPPGSRVQFELIQSPVHMKHCPSYDKIEVVLKPIVLPRVSP